MRSPFTLGSYLVAPVSLTGSKVEFGHSFNEHTITLCSVFELLVGLSLETEHHVEVVLLSNCPVVICVDVGSKVIPFFIVFMHVGTLAAYVRTALYIMIVCIIGIPVTRLGQHTIVQLCMDIPAFERLDDEVERVVVVVGLCAVVTGCCKTQRGRGRVIQITVGIVKRQCRPA